MRQVFAVLLILFSTLHFSQDMSNPFADEDTQAKESAYSTDKITTLDKEILDEPEKKEPTSNLDDGPPNPGDPIPIDQYVLVLIIAAAGIIIYTTRKKTKTLS